MSFRNHRLAVAITARAVSFLGNGFADIALVLRLQPHGAAAVAGVLACNLLPIVVLAGVIGRVVDAVDERILLVVSGVAQAVVCVALARVSDPAGIFAAVALLGAGQAVNGATWGAVLPALAPPGRLAWALSRSQAALMLAGVVAPALGGVLVAAFDTSVPLLIDAVTFLLLAASGAVLGRVRVRADAGDRVGGLEIVRRSPVLRAMVGLLALVVLLGSTVNVAEVFLVRSTLHSGALAFGLCGAAYSVGALSGALWSGRVATPPGQARVLLRSMIALGAGLVAMGLAPDVAALLVAATVTGVMNGMLNVTAAALVLGATPAHLRGRVSAMQNGALSAAQLAAYGSSAALATVLGPRAIFVLGGALAACAPLLAGRALLHAVGAGRGQRVRTALVADPALNAAMRELSLTRISGPR